MRRLLRALGALFALTVIAPSVIASETTADGSFGRGGAAWLDMPGRDFATHVAVAPDGKVILIGSVSEHRIGLVRFTSSGQLDRSFSYDGALTMSVGDYAYPVGLAVGRDGSIVFGTSMQKTRRFSGVGPVDFVASVATDPPRMALVKLRPDGKRDLAFGKKGIARTDKLRVIDAGVGLALAPDGSIIVITITGAGLGYYGGVWDSLMMRFTPEGEHDLSFGTAGVVTFTPESAFVRDVVVQPNGRIVVGSILFAPFTSDYLVQRFMPSGMPDTGFGVGGTTLIDSGGFQFGYDALEGVTLQPDGKILAFGYATHPGRGWIPAVARLKTDGSPDSFGRFGTQRFAIGEGPGGFTDVAVRKDGAIFAIADVLSGRSFAPFLVSIAKDGRSHRVVEPITRLGFAGSLAAQGDRLFATGPSDRYTPNGFFVTAYQP